MKVRYALDFKGVAKIASGGSGDKAPGFRVLVEAVEKRVHPLWDCGAAPLTKGDDLGEIGNR
jgi:hypothetical protein